MSNFRLATFLKHRQYYRIDKLVQDLTLKRRIHSFKNCFFVLVEAYVIVPINEITSDCIFVLMEGSFLIKIFCFICTCCHRSVDEGSCLQRCYAIYTGT